MKELSPLELKRAIAFRQAIPEGQYDPRFVGGRPESGVLCPWNRDGSGPAKRRIWCFVWKDENDLHGEWGSSGNYRFCRSVCHYGHMDSEQRNRAAKAQRAFYFEKKRRWGFARKIARFSLRDVWGRRI